MDTSKRCLRFRSLSKEEIKETQPLSTTFNVVSVRRVSSTPMNKAFDDIDLEKTLNLSAIQSVSSKEGQACASKSLCPPSRRGMRKSISHGALSSFNNSSDVKRKNVERTVLESQYLQSLFMKLTAEEVVKKVENDGLEQVEQIIAANQNLVESLREDQRKLAEMENQESLLKVATDRMESAASITKAVEAIGRNMAFVKSGLKEREEKLILLNTNIKESPLNERISIFGSFDSQSDGLRKNETLKECATIFSDFCTELERAQELQTMTERMTLKLKQVVHKKNRYQEALNELGQSHV